MFQIKDLLEKFKEVEDPKKVRLTIVFALNQILRADLVTEDDIEYKKNVVRIKANPAIRHRILSSKQACLDRLRDLLPHRTIIDVC